MSKKTLFGNIIRAVMSGELLLRLKIDRFLGHILYLFFAAWLTIFTSLKIDQTLQQVERNKTTLKTLKIRHAQKTYELAQYDRLSTVEEMLEEAGSEVAFPQKPASRIKVK